MAEPLFSNIMEETERVMHTPSEFARTALFYLQETGTLQAKRIHKSSRQNMASYLFFIVQSGSGILEYSHKSYPLNAGDCVFIDCRKPYSHVTSERLWKLKWAHFYGSTMGIVYEKYLARGGKPCFHSENVHAYQELLDQLYTVANTFSYVQDMEIHEKLSGLLVLLMEDSWNPDNRSIPVRKMQDIQRVRDYLDQNYRNKISLDDLGEKFYINKFYLLELFKEQYGTTINDYLIHVRINHGKQLLRFTDMKMEEISYQCGIGGANYFSRVFKKVEGMSPSEYKKTWRKT